MLSLTFTLSQGEAAEAKPLALHPENGHYMLFRGKPAVLITSGEHYGAVLNLDFDYNTYLDTLKADGLNLTRLFSGVYREIPSSFGIAENTLAPQEGRYAAPWARSATPGYTMGGNKFDLTKWDDAYFKRLKDFVGQAGKRGIVVEMVLFCPFYDEGLWKADPMNSINNVNGIGDMPLTEVYTLKHPEMVAIHDAFVRKVVGELNGFDNVYYEICNEPYFGGVTLDWQRHISQTIVDTEKPLRNKHLIAQNIANESAKVEDPDPNVSIFNFHYASPPVAVRENYGLGKVISFDETGFKGTKDETYRQQAWEFLMAGGGIFDNLDYSFTAKHPRGDFHYPDSQPGGGSIAYRQQLSLLHAFMRDLSFVRMKPIYASVPGSADASIPVLAEPGRAYATYLAGAKPTAISFDAPAGTYRVEWISPTTGKVVKSDTVTHAGGALTLNAPAYDVDIALKVRASR